MAGNKRWIGIEIDVLKENYGKIDVDILAEQLNRSVDAVHWQASKLGIAFDKNETIPNVVRQYNSINTRLTEIENALKRLENALVNKEVSKSEDKWLTKCKLYAAGVRGENLIAWATHNRKQYHAGKLSTERINKLLEIGFNFNTHRDNYLIQWNKCFDDYVNGIRNSTIRNWKARCRDRYEKKELTKEQINKLKSINFKFQKRQRHE